MKPAAIVVLALFAASAMAQINGVPASVASQTSRSFSPGVPASVTSQTSKSYTPGVPASVTSLGPNGFQAGAPFGAPLTRPTTTISCIAGGAYCAPTTFPAVNTGLKHGHRHNRFGFGYGYGYGGYLYAPYMYSDYPAYSPDGADMGAGYNYLQPSTVTVEPDPPAPTIYERRPTTRPYARDEARYDNDYRGPASDSAPRSTTIGVGEQETTTLVFADGHQMDVHNYAIVGQNLFNFDGTGPFKIKLAELNLHATEKVNEDNGVEFKLPK